ncbi:hypothetical protein ACFFMN_23885 [Planobispora siamensis]|uniref:Uncharacterized protein n=1 Tax=Planobispora siamensis TaxID=936338 RepID=A0A8J3SJ70_9ACTN|nr:hypothetical protein [Planobispora siamensis]GIH95378.1 hypothetical protein Psi01_60080 [Planobispora siamensis]
MPSSAITSPIDALRACRDLLAPVPFLSETIATNRQINDAISSAYHTAKNAVAAYERLERNWQQEFQPGTWKVPLLWEVPLLPETPAPEQMSVELTSEHARLAVLPLPEGFALVLSGFDMPSDHKEADAVQEAFHHFAVRCGAKGGWVFGCPVDIV